MVRDMESFYPRKEEMGNGPIELVLGDVLDKVSFVSSRLVSSRLVLSCSSFVAAAATEQDKVTRFHLYGSQREHSAAQGRLKSPPEASPLAAW